MRLVQQKKTDLRNVGSGGDMDIEVMLIAGEIFSPAEIVESGVNFLEIPGVGERNFLPDHLGVGGTDLNVLRDCLEKFSELRLIQKIISVEVQILLHGESDRWTPDSPAAVPASVIVQRASEKGNQNIHGILFFYWWIWICG